MAKFTYKAHQKYDHPVKFKPWRALLVFVILATTLSVLEITNTTYIFHKQKAVSGVVPTTPISNKPSVPSGATTTSNKGQSSTPVSQNTTTSSAELVAPWGLFVNNHSRGLSASVSSEISACNTTAGASCYIEFKQGNVTKTLAAQIADSSGIASWSWDVSKAGLTVGQWQISATATLGGKTLTTQDPLALDIQQ